MSNHELELLKEAAKKFAQECNTPEKARAHLIKIGYLPSKKKTAKRAV